MKQNQKLYRQGDVLIVELDNKEFKNIPDWKDARENGRVILAHGEVTGHAHVVHGTDVEFQETIGADQQASRILNVMGRDAELKHDEHATITIPVGRYKVVRQREYTPQEIRRVAD